MHDLFLQLTPEMQRHLEDRWNRIVRDREELLKNVDCKENKPIPRAIRDALVEGREGFERLRYVYEGGEPFRFFLGDLPLALRRTILDLQPPWAQQDNLFLGRIPADPIPEHLKEGSITAWLRHSDEDWTTNDKHYDFEPFKNNAISLIAYKTKRRRISLTVSGPLGRTFTFNEPAVSGNEKGLFVAVTWSTDEVLLYLNEGLRARIAVGAS